MKITNKELVMIIAEEIVKESTIGTAALKKNMRSADTAKQVGALSTKEREVAAELQSILAFVSGKDVDIKLSGAVEVALNRFKKAIGMPEQTAAQAQPSATAQQGQPAQAVPATQQRQGVKR